ncbi:hypothetical protein [Roseateles amylovorans]|uniref:Nitrogen fixation protein FixH n=1 Tax=Roseateles amylovorans TaxID=2978473 RepID=A0ABY6B482_9BURK|nr:hypothetical protein [Roseateles amylovorans]UXH80054.1 hypothetical protein N4261_09305 [Roseateles amylovorans]
MNDINKEARRPQAATGGASMPDLPSSGPWWRHRMMWLVVGGPSVVVLASFVTLALAITHPDPVVKHESGGVVRQAADEADASLAPAMNARNHAATGGQPQ